MRRPTAAGDAKRESPRASKLFDVRGECLGRPDMEVRVVAGGGNLQCQSDRSGRRESLMHIEVALGDVEQVGELLELSAVMQEVPNEMLDRRKGPARVEREPPIWHHANHVTAEA